MYKVRSVRLSSKLLNLIGLAILVFSTFLTGSIGVAYAQEPLAGDYYYYANGNRIQLTPSLNWASVKFVSDDPAAQSAALKNSGAALGTLDQARQIPHPKLTLLPLEGSLTKQTINSLRADTANFLQVNPVFQTVDAEMAITDEFIATFPAGISMEEIDVINSSYGVEMVEPILGQENTFVLRVANAKLDVLSMANLYQESGAAIYSAPNFVRIVKTSPSEGQTIRQDVGPMAGTNDTLYTNQWYLNNIQQYGTGTTYDADIDAPEAWDHTTGSSTIIIAVIDEGTDLTHEDYSSKLVAGYDATGLGSGGGPSGNDAHGTNVAGIAAASSNNNLGVAGVCQNCKIMPVRIAYGVADNWVTDDATIATGIAWAYLNGADVLNNSWGGGTEATVINTAFSNARIHGRAGKGAVIVVSAGNDNASSVSYPANLTDVIAVGASNMCDQRKTPSANDCNREDWWGSNYGSALDISAPGVWLASTDIMGAAGYTTSNYYAYFNGTSGAAPVVSGVAGLVLSVNPNLTAVQVQTILQSTADDVNGGGWDVEMGYGRVNANAAVLAAAAPPPAYSIYLPMALRNFPLTSSGPTPGFWQNSDDTTDFYVTSDGTTVRQFSILVNLQGCGTYWIFRGIPDGDIAISSNQFSVSESFYASGTFDSSTTAHGISGLSSFFGPCGLYWDGGPWPWNTTWQNGTQPTSMLANAAGFDFLESVPPNEGAYIAIPVK